MNIIEKAIPHIFRNKYLQGQGGTVILGGSGGGSNSSSTGSGGASQLDDLTDVTVDYLKNEDILQFDEGSGQWKNKALIVDWSRVDNTPTTLEGYGITDAVHKSHLDDNVRHITQAERNKWNSSTSELNDHINDEVRHVTEEDKENWNNPMIKKLKDVKLDEVKDNDILIYRDSDELWHNEQLPEYDWKKILKVNEDGEVVSKFNIVVEGECFIWDEEADRELTPIKDADSYKLISSIGDELRISANLIIVRNISYESSESPIIEAEITNYIGITENGDIIINSLRILEGNLIVVDPAITKEKNDYLKDALYFDSSGVLRCKVPFIGDHSISVTGGAHDTLFPGENGTGNVVDNLDSYDAYSSLSANQGRILNEKIENISFDDLTDHPTTLKGYGITDSLVSNTDLDKHIEDARVHCTEEEKILWDAAANLRHEHYNNIILDSITQEDIDKWNAGGGTVEIVDNLTTPDPNKALSANQGYLLSQSIDNIISGGSGNLTNYYTKDEVDDLIDNIDVPDVDLSNYYNKSEVDGLIDAIPETDLTNYYNKSEVDGLIDSIPETDLTNYYNKSEVDALIEAIDIPESGTTSNVVSFSATRNRYYKLFELSPGGTINFTIQSGANMGGAYTFSISYLTTKGIIVNQLCGSGSGINSIKYKKYNNVYEIYAEITTTATITFISNGFGYTTLETPSYVTSSSGMTSFAIKENTISTTNINATKVTALYYVIENTDGTYSDIASLISSLESRIAALEGGA